jgi:hypothetical protein
VEVSADVDNASVESEADGEPRESPVRSPNGSNLSVFKHNIRKSIGTSFSGFLNEKLINLLKDKTVQLYKSSAIAQRTGRTASALVLSMDAGEEDSQSRRSHSERESWEDDALIRDGKCFS